MATRTLAPAIRTTVENFVHDLQRLLARAAIDAVREGSIAVDETRQPAPVRRTASPTRVEPAPAAPAPRGAAAASKRASTVYTFDDYERAAIQRALRETGDDRLQAANLLGASKSTIYRRIKMLGIRSSQLPRPDDIGRDLPLDLLAYEGRAVAAVLEAANGDKQTAARLIGASKSSFYRATARHGL